MSIKNYFEKFDDMSTSELVEYLKKLGFSIEKIPTNIQHYILSDNTIKYNDTSTLNVDISIDVDKSYEVCPEFEVAA